MRVPAPHESLRQREFLDLLRRWYGVTTEILAMERTPEGIEQGPAKLHRQGFRSAPLHYVPEQTMSWITAEFYLRRFGVDPDEFAARVDRAE